MTRVIADMSMSIDGFVADVDDGIDRLFGWYGNGDVVTPTANPGIVFRTSHASAARLEDALTSVGALVVGRHLFELTGGWGGVHPMGVPVVVVTHREPATWLSEDAPFTFVQDGVAAAIDLAKAKAGSKNVGIASAKVAQQALDLGLLDEIHVNVVPVILGSGVPFFENLRRSPVELGDPTVIEGQGVTHLAYVVQHG